MRILIVTPAPAGSRQGNRVTALRWARLLRALGHHAQVATGFTGQRCDLIVALHARKSAESVARWRRERPAAPLVVALTGTDLYQDLPRSAAARRSLALADRLVLLQPDGRRFLPQDARRKAVVIRQSAPPTHATPAAERDGASRFDVLVVGHLRHVKDPFRAALAARRLSGESRIRVLQLGRALAPAMERFALRETRTNPRYRWLGELSHAETLRWMARARLLAITSRAEGGANVISEAISRGLPVVASRISGSIGLLGAGYPGYFPVGDTQALAALLERCESDEPFYRRLVRACERLRPLVTPEAEREAWRRLLALFDA